MIIRNAFLALPSQDELVAGELRIQGGKITEIGVGRALETHGEAEIINAEGLAVLPGAIDAHVHFFDPGYTHKEDFLHGSGASASGGVTTVVDMPDTSEPAVIDAHSIQEKLSVVSAQSLVDFGFFGGISGLLCDEELPRRVAEMAPEVLGIKTYATSGAAHFPRVSNHQYYKVLTETRRHNCIVLVHAEDYDYVSGATPEARAQGDGGMAFYLSRPEAAETLSVLTVTEIAEELGAPMHIVHLGTIRAAEIVAKCRFVSGETCPQYLEFDCNDFQRIGGALKITPPVKGPENRSVLLKMLAEGQIDFIASDHAPGTREEKNTGSIWTDYAGIPGGPTLFPYILSEGYLSGLMGLQRFLEITSGNPARRYRIADRKGAIAVGLDADLVFIDTAGSSVVRGEESFSKGKVTPFEGKELRGKVLRTMVRGRTVFHSEHGVIGEPGTGQFLRPDPKLRSAGVQPWRG
ncbi:MAG: hypothetical protein EA428_06290 [Spirochaetaceae bacterium]|nr:MAG: hypothetical protein EA428_06290 [Spirochaetaceae bacterium]